MEEKNTGNESSEEENTNLSVVPSGNNTPAAGTEADLQHRDAEDQPSVVEKKKEPKNWLGRTVEKVKTFTAEGFLAEGVMEMLIPKIKPLILRAKPKLVKYMQGYNELTKDWNLDESGQKAERIIIVRLTPDKEDVAVMVYKKRFTRISIPKGMDIKEAVEQTHSAEAWLSKTLFGGNYDDFFRKEMAKDEEGGEEGQEKAEESKE